MNTKKQYEKELKKLLKNEKTDINEIDDLMIKALDKCRQDLLKSTEDILMTNIDENRLITKKTRMEKERNQT